MELAEPAEPVEPVEPVETDVSEKLEEVRRFFPENDENVRCHQQMQSASECPDFLSFLIFSQH